MLTAEQADQLRDSIEADLAQAMRQAIRRFLARTRTAAAGLDTDAVLTAAAGLALGDLMGWWASEVDNRLAESVLAAFNKAAARQVAGGITIPAGDAAQYLTRVRDRLKHGLSPPLPEDAFNKIRSSLAQASAQGWTRQALGRRIAEQLAWEPNKSYWQQQLERANTDLDVLDFYGPPGSQAREDFKNHSPLVQSLQADRAEAIRHIEADQSDWEMRAERISRTESTAANNYAALQALAREGVTHKQWLATHDKRTRPTHAEADGQIQALGQPFLVGGYTLMMPGDPSAPGSETINCRCDIIGVPAPEDLLAAKERSEADAIQEQLHQKWFGKPPPEQPGARPDKPVPGAPSRSEFDAWLQAAEARYQAYGGGAHGTLKQSNNWYYFERVMSGNRIDAEAAVDYLLKNHYLDDALAKQALQLYRADVSAEQLRLYRNAINRWRRHNRQFNQNLAEWRWVNGVSGEQLQGMTGALDFATDQEGIGWAMRHLANLSNTPAGRALNEYTGSAYRSWNDYLRRNAGKPLTGRSQWNAKTKALDGAFTSRLPQDIYLSRGGGWDEFELGGIRKGMLADPTKLIGTVQTQHGYLSASIGHQASGFGNVKTIYRVPKNTPIANAMSVSRFGTGEREVLLPRGTRFYIHSVHQTSRGQWVVEAEVIPDSITNKMLAGARRSPLTKRVGDRFGPGA